MMSDWEHKGRRVSRLSNARKWKYTTFLILPPQFPENRPTFAFRLLAAGSLLRLSFASVFTMCSLCFTSLILTHSPLFTDCGGSHKFCIGITSSFVDCFLKVWEILPLISQGHFWGKVDGLRKISFHYPQGHFFQIVRGLSGNFLKISPRNIDLRVALLYPFT